MRPPPERERPRSTLAGVSGPDRKGIVATAILPQKSPSGTSLRQAINAKCRDCIYDRFAPGNWRQQVAACSCPACPLYPVRPVSKGAGKAPEIDPAAVLA